MWMYWFKCCCCIVSSTVFPGCQKMYELPMTEHASYFIKKELLKKKKEIKYCLLLFSDVIIQTSSSYSETY